MPKGRDALHLGDFLKKVPWPVAGKTIVIGVGNLLLKDEGVGVHAVRELQKEKNLPGVEVVDGGVAGIGLIDLFQGAEKLILVDAAEMALPPGSVVRFTPEEIRSRADVERPRFSSHEVGVLEVLEVARALGQCPPEVVVIGIQPKEISWGTELSPEVEASLPRVVSLVLEEIRRTA